MKNLNRIFLFILCVGLFITSATAQSASNFFDQANQDSVQKNIISQYEKSGVRVQSYWLIMNTKTNEPFFFLFVPVKTLKQKGININSPHEAVPVYVETDNGSYEPILVAKGKFNQAAGHIASVGGVAVTKDGFIATASWAIAPWNSAVKMSKNSLPNGIVVSADLKRVVNVDAPPPTNWIPSKTKAQRGTIANLGIKVDFNLENSNNKIELEVLAFQQDKSLPAQLVSTSIKHDVGLIKVNPTVELNTFELYDNYDLLKKDSADNFIIQGYLDGTLEVMKTLVKTTYSDEMGTTIQLVNNFSDTEKAKKDMYQTTLSVFGYNGCGIPVFDNKGRVIGMYLSYNEKTQTHNVIPIRFVKELMQEPRVK